MRFAAIDISKGEVSYGPDQIEVMSKVQIMNGKVWE